MDVPVQTEVGIIGGGPTGIALAIELTSRGIPFLVFEKNLHTSAHPKSLTTNARSMELLRRFGLTKRIRNSGLPPGYLTDIFYRTSLLRGEEIARFPLLQNCCWATPEPQYQVTQQDLEKILLQHAQENITPNSRFFYGVEVTDSVIGETGVELEIQGGQKVSCKYLVGCDGSHSFLRRKVGATLVSSTEPNEPRKEGFLNGKMLGVQFICPSLRGHAEEEGVAIGWMHWIFNNNVQAVLLALNAEDHFILHLKPDGQNTIDEEYCRTRIHAAIGLPLDTTILSFEEWQCGHALVASQYVAPSSNPRCFLVGDAAHLFTPTGAFGLNTGLADVADLGWKLAAVIQGWGGSSLLTTYQDERKPIAIFNSLKALEGSKKIAQVSTMIMEYISAGRSCDLQELRQPIINLSPNPYMHGPQLGYIYSHSKIIVNPHPENHTETPMYVAGARLPHSWLSESQSIYDKIALNGFTLFCSKEGCDIAKSLVAEAVVACIPITTITVELLHFPSMVLVRPDFHIAWLNESSEAVDTRQVLNIVRGV